MQALSWPGQGFSFKLVTMMSSSVPPDYWSLPWLWVAGPDKERVSALKVEARKANPKPQILKLNAAGDPVWEKGLKTKNGPSKMGGGLEQRQRRRRCPKWTAHAA